MTFYTAPLSRRDIRALALEFRRRIRRENALYFNVPMVLEMLPILYDGFHFEIVEMSYFGDPDIHAETDIEACCIRIREDVYKGAWEYNGRDRMTICHEIGHFVIINVCGTRLYRRFDGQKIKAYCSPEWQAKCFGGELLIPKHLVGGMSVEEVVDFCCVSRKAAEYQLKKYKEEGGDTDRDWKSKRLPGITANNSGKSQRVTHFRASPFCLSLTGRL